MKTQSRHLSLTVLFALMTASTLMAQETPAEPSADTPATERVQRQDRARVHQPADGIAVQQGIESQVRTQDRTRVNQPVDGTAMRTRIENQARTQNRVRPDGATAARAEARRRSMGNASGTRSAIRQRARVHRPGQ
jgi:hypothetical protein